jgi:hypothetical protein
MLGLSGPESCTMNAPVEPPFEVPVAPLAPPVLVALPPMPLAVLPPVKPAEPFPLLPPHDAAATMIAVTYASKAQK